MTQTVELKDYNLIGTLDDEKDALESFTTQDESNYVADAISQVADDYIPIYNNDIWSNAHSIQEHIEEAIAQGLAPTDGDIDLVRIFQAGYYQYYTQSLYDNLDAIAYNMIAEKINVALNKFGANAIDDINFGELENEIESATGNFDNNETIGKITEIADDIIYRMGEGEFNV